LVEQKLLNSCLSR